LHLRYLLLRLEFLCCLHCSFALFFHWVSGMPLPHLPGGFTAWVPGISLYFLSLCLHCLDFSGISLGTPHIFLLPLLSHTRFGSLETLPGSLSLEGLLTCTFSPLFLLHLSHSLLLFCIFSGMPGSLSAWESLHLLLCCSGSHFLLGVYRFSPFSLEGLSGGLFLGLFLGILFLFCTAHFSGGGGTHVSGILTALHICFHYTGSPLCLLSPALPPGFHGPRFLDYTILSHSLDSGFSLGLSACILTFPLSLRVAWVRYLLILCRYSLFVHCLPVLHLEGYCRCYSGSGAWRWGGTTVSAYSIRFSCHTIFYLGRFVEVSPLPAFLLNFWVILCSLTPGVHTSTLPACVFVCSLTACYMEL